MDTHRGTKVWRYATFTTRGAKRYGFGWEKTCVDGEVGDKEKFRKEEEDQKKNPPASTSHLCSVAVGY